MVSVPASVALSAEVSAAAKVPKWAYLMVEASVEASVGALALASALRTVEKKVAVSASGSA